MIKRKLERDEDEKNADKDQGNYNDVDDSS